MWSRFRRHTRRKNNLSVNLQSAEVFEERISPVDLLNMMSGVGNYLPPAPIGVELTFKQDDALITGSFQVPDSTWIGTRLMTYVGTGGSGFSTISLFTTPDSQRFEFRQVRQSTLLNQFYYFGTFGSSATPSGAFSQPADAGAGGVSYDDQENTARSWLSITNDGSGGVCNTITGPKSGELNVQMLGFAAGTYLVSLQIETKCTLSGNGTASVKVTTPSASAAVVLTLALSPTSFGSPNEVSHAFPAPGSSADSVTTVTDQTTLAITTGARTSDVQLLTWGPTVAFLGKGSVFISGRVAITSISKVS